MRIQAVEFSRVCVSSSFSNLLFFDFWCNFIAPCARFGQLFGGFCLAGRVLGGGGEVKVCSSQPESSIHISDALWSKPRG